ncbi:FG-GAP-like repeat-containing protein [Caulobacter sp. CCNWLY153]|uniref:beta strand repeat-containing protein n=1 Tax=unclassified Caulobacter TaxID=2648921 RepID=UPI002FF3E46F
MPQLSYGQSFSYVAPVNGVSDPVNDWTVVFSTARWTQTGQSSTTWTVVGAAGTAYAGWTFVFTSGFNYIHPAGGGAPSGYTASIQGFAPNSANAAFTLSGLNFDMAGLSTNPAGLMAGITGFTGSSGADVLQFSASLANGLGTFDGGGGDDTIRVLQGALTVRGGAGADTIEVVRNPGLTFGYDTSARTQVYGDDGDDVIISSISNVQAFGGAGNDSFVVSGNLIGQSFDGGAGNDSASIALVGQGLNYDVRQIFLDKAGANYQFTSVENLTVNASDATVVITSGAGDYRIVGVGNAVFQISGGAGNDRITGGNNGDWISGGAGDDVLDGGNGWDTLDYSSATAGLTLDMSLVGVAQDTGGAGVDTLSNFEVVVGSQYNDVIRGGGGVLNISGGAGDDVIIGGPGVGTYQGLPVANILSGGDGEDRFVFESVQDSTSARPDTITDFVHGVDKVDLSMVTGEVRIIHNDNVNRGGGPAGTTILFGGDGQGNFAGKIIVANAWISGDDLILAPGSAPVPVYMAQISNSFRYQMDARVGDGRGETYFGGDGVDKIVGAPSDSALTNIIGGGGGADLLYAGVGSKNLFLVNARESSFDAPDTVFDFQVGVDKIGIGANVAYEIQAQGNGDSLLLFDADGLGGYRGAVLVKGVTLTAANVDTSAIASQSQTVSGSWGVHVVGGYGADRIASSSPDQIEYLEGGAGAANTFAVNNAAHSSSTRSDYVIDFRPGVDKLDLGAVAGSRVLIEVQEDGDSYVWFAPDARGVFQGRLIVRNAVVQGSDLITPATTQLIVQGSAAGDVLTGGARADLIYGGAGDDVITGGAGADFLSGGLGADDFVFRSPSEGGDVISDFRGGVDRIVLDAKGFGVQAGNLSQAGVVFVADAPPGAHAPTLIYKSSDGTLWWDADGSGAGAAVLLANIGTYGVKVLAQETLPSRTTSAGGPTALGTAWSVSAPGDFDGDGTKDILFADNTGATQIWTQQRGQRSGTLVPGSHGAGWSVAAVADFNGDGDSDILWRNNATGQADVWLLKNGSWIGGFAPNSPGATWQVVGTGDFNGDGSTDILWRDSATGALNGQIYRQGVQVSTFDGGARSTDWMVKSLTDFNKDGKADILWVNAATNTLEIATQTATGFNVTLRVNLPGTLVGVTDMTGDGVSDLVFLNAANTIEIYAITNGGTVNSFGKTGAHVAGWSVAGVADYTGDGYGDVLWRNDATGAFDLWELTGVQWRGSSDPSQHTANWSYAGAGDFNGDGFNDLLWLDSATGRSEAWLMQNGQVIGTASPGNHGGTIAAVGDFNGDGFDDILWKNADGSLDGWLLNYSYYKAGFSPGGPGAAWTLENYGDFNADGTTDLLYRDRATGQTMAWLVENGKAAGSFVLGVHNTDYGVQAVGDFNGDGSSDVFWRNPTTGQVDVWLLKDGIWAGSVQPGFYNTQWVFAGVGDFNGDGTDDVLWRNTQTGQNDIWLLNNGGWAGSVDPGAMGTAWSVSAVQDVNHDGIADIIWRNASTGATIEWLMGSHGGHLLGSDILFG